MIRNMDLCRELLLQIEETDYLKPEKCEKIQSKGYSLDEIIYHCRLIHQHGLIKECEINGAMGIVSTFIVGEVTWEGHVFLEKIRQDTVRNKTKEVYTQKGLPMILDVVKEVSATVIASMTEGAIKALKN